MSIKKFREDKPYNKILFESENFFVIPSLGALVEGWLLVIPKEHYISMGYIKDPKLHIELNSVIKATGEVVEKIYGDFVVFENGACSFNDKVGCGVDYAHVHIVPTKLNLIEQAKYFFDISFLWKNITDFSETHDFIKAGKPYLYYRDQKNNSLITTSENIPSQLFRKALAYSLNIPDEYDWKKNEFLNNVEKSIVNYQKNVYV